MLPEPLLETATMLTQTADRAALAGKEAVSLPITTVVAVADMLTRAAEALAL